MSEARAAHYILPAVLIGRADLARLAREVEAVENDLESQKVRASAGATGYHMSTVSRLLIDFVTLNKIEVASDKALVGLKEDLRLMKDKAPILHMTFATDADEEFLQQLVQWVRAEIHPHALIDVGLQPRIIGGVHVRTPNQVHDFSVRALLKGKRSIIVRELEVLHAG